MRPLSYNLLSQRFGRLLVIGYALGKWLCRCDCGTEKAIASGHLRSGVVVSCGCYILEVVKRPRKHGMASTRVQKIWIGMHQRCENPKNKAFSGYGGRGIKVCDHWKEFANFYADMGDPPLGMSLERCNNELGYEPSNCRWATTMEQNRNTRKTRFIEINGQRRSLAEWCQLQKLPYTTAHARLRRGWSNEAALGFGP